MTEPVHAHLKDVAYLIDRKVTTVRGDWQERVRKGQIPAPLKDYAHPTWNRAKLIAWLEGERDEVAQPQKRRGTATLDPDAEALRAAMRGNRGGARHAA